MSASENQYLPKI